MAFCVPVANDVHAISALGSVLHAEGYRTRSFVAISAHE